VFPGAIFGLLTWKPMPCNSSYWSNDALAAGGAAAVGAWIAGAGFVPSNIRRTVTQFG